MTPLVVDAEVKSKLYKTDIIEFEKSVKDWRESSLIEISDLAEKCYDAFNDFQMTITEIAETKIRDKYQKDCYKSTYNFLVFVENKVNPDFATFLINNSSKFNSLIKHYSKYCTRMEKKYNLELDVEKEFLD